MKLALLQMTTGDSVAENIETVSAMIAEAADAGAELVCTPECTHLMELKRGPVLEKASFEADDKGLKAMRDLAAQHKIWLVIGSLVIKVADDRLVNRQYLIAPDGSVHSTYDKIHLFDVDLAGGESYRESALYDSGDEAVVSKTPFGTLGHSICYDLRFPYLHRALAAAGANILLIPAAFTQKTGEAHWHTLMKARAIETGCFVVAAAQTGLHATGRSTYGHSLVVAPWGEVVMDAGTEPGVYTCEIDLAKVEKARQTVPSMQHTREFEVKVV